MGGKCGGSVVVSARTGWCANAGSADGADALGAGGCETAGDGAAGTGEGGSGSSKGSPNGPGMFEQVGAGSDPRIGS